MWSTFKKREQKTTTEKKKDFLNAIDVPKLSEDQVNLCEEDLTEKDLYPGQISRKRWLDKRILRNLLGRAEGNLCKFHKGS